MANLSPDIQAGRRPQIIDAAIPNFQFVEVKEPELMALELKGQKWAITGLGSEKGIGFAIARLAGLRGAEIYGTATAKNQDRALATVDKLRDMGMTVHWTASDLRDPGAGRQFIRDAVNRMGDIDVVVSNAGQTADMQLKDITTPLYADALRLGLLAPFEIKQTAAEVMAAREANWGGSILDVSSVARWGNVGQFVYASIKAGIVAQNMSISDELARRRKVRANALEVGIVPGTPITEDLSPGVIRRAVQLAGAEAPVKPDEVAEAAVILASPNRSSGITRAVLQVIGGENYDRYQIEPKPKEVA